MPSMESCNTPISIPPISVPPTASPTAIPDIVTERHLHWQGLVTGPRTESPITVNGLLDTGAHVVLINNDLVDLLGLPRHRLYKPLSVSVAMNTSSPTSLPPSRYLHEYVNLSVSSLDQSWHSKSVKAVIAPSLCTSILFGLPFLSRNKIIIDTELRTATCKEDGYDLLNPKPIKQSKACLSPPAQRRANLRFMKHVKTLKVDALKELTSRTSRIEGNEIPCNTIASLLRDRIENLAHQEYLQTLESSVKEKFKDVFEPIPHVNDLPRNVEACINLKDASKSITSRSYACPRKYREAWKTLLQQHLDAGRIRPSSSPVASPAFIVPKTDPKALPRWVNDYRQLNDNTVTDSHPLPRVDDILADCAKGKIWSVIDMTNSFFQTPMRESDIHLTAVTTPFGLYEWVVMPMGMKNAPAIHQRRVTHALRHLLGKICHIYLDDIVIWSDSIEQHEKDIQLVLEAMRTNSLYCNPNKTKLFQEEISFLGHTISRRGIEADQHKAQRILDWPTPKSASDVRSFLGLVRYISVFLPSIAEHTRILTPLTSKFANKSFPEWDKRCHTAFNAIKQAVASRECLTTIDYNAMSENKIFVTTDASEYQSGAVLSFGPTWESARPVAFESQPFKGAQLHYPVHEKEMLAIIRALSKWRADLLGVPFLIYTDHRTLENFNVQRDLSRRQARWMEFMSQYDSRIVYLQGKDNTVADALSRVVDSTTADGIARDPYHVLDTSDEEDVLALVYTSEDWPAPALAASGLSDTVFPDVKTEIVAPVLSIEHEKDLLDGIRSGYTEDRWCRNLLDASKITPHGVTIRDGLIFIGSRLVIPRSTGIREHLYRLAHDVLGHFGFEKSYGSLRDSFYWPNMRRDLELGYVPACADCQRNKSPTTKPRGPLHPLPVPDNRGDSVAMDFVGPLPKDEGFDMILTMTDRAGSDVRFVPTHVDLTAEELARLFFDHWYCENGLPLHFVCDRDKLFISKFWSSLHQLTGIKIKMSTAYHPQSDGSSERTNKTLNQCLRFFVERNQKGWVKALPRIRFSVMNTVNASTGYTPFQLRMGRSPRVIPPMILTSEGDIVDTRAQDVIERLEKDTAEAADNLLKAKIDQAMQANKHRSDDFPFQVGGRALLSTYNRRRQYLKADEKRVAKFMPRYDGPYLITAINPSSSTVTLEIPNAPVDAYTVFHTSQLLPFTENDDTLFPSRHEFRQTPIIMPDGSEEFVIDKIIDEKRVGRGFRYLVRWLGEGPDQDRWLPRRELEDCEALDIWLAKKNDLTDHVMDS